MAAGLHDACSSGVHEAWISAPRRLLAALLQQVLLSVSQFLCLASKGRVLTCVVVVRLPKRDDSGKKYSTKKCPTCKVECTKRMLSFHVTVEEITSGLRFPVYVGISEEQTKVLFKSVHDDLIPDMHSHPQLPLLQKLKQVTGSAKPGNLSVEFYHSLFERFMQRMVGDEESREAGESFLKHCAWMVYTVAKYDTTSVALCDYEKP